jgi:hypothetical protein
MALPKWTDERTAQLTAFVGSESPVSQDTVAEAADELETSTRSVSSKLLALSAQIKKQLLLLLSLTTAVSTPMLKLLSILKAELSPLSLSKARFCLWN